MATLLTLPELPRAPMYVGGVMSRPWQEFFRSLFKRTGGNEELSNTELAALLRLNQRTITADDTVIQTDGTIFIDATAGDIEITMLSAVDLGAFIYYFKRIDDSDNSVTLVSSGSETIDNDSSHNIYSMENISLTSDDTNWWITP